MVSVDMRANERELNGLIKGRRDMFSLWRMDENPYLGLVLFLVCSHPGFLERMIFTLQHMSLIYHCKGRGKNRWRKSPEEEEEEEAMQENACESATPMKFITSMLNITKISRHH